MFSTTVVQLTLEDTWSGILTHLAQASGRRVILVLPSRNQALDAPSRMRLLREAAADVGKHVALVTHDPEVVEAARVAGVPTFGSVWRARWLPWWHSGIAPLPPRPTLPSMVLEDARAALPPLPRWADYRRRLFPKAGSALELPPHWWPWVRAVTALLLLLGVITLAVWLMLWLAPWASIVLMPAPASVEVTLDLSAHPGVERADVGLGVVPARYVEVVVEDTIYVPATGRRLAPSTRATGTVVFTNRVDQEVHIPRGTIVSTSTGRSVSFRTLQDATVPPLRGARVEVPIEAEKPGPQGNVRAFTISQVSGPLALQVVVTNPEPTSGGDVKEVSVVIGADKDVARARALQVLTERATEELTKKQYMGEFIPRETVQTFVMAETYDHFAGDEAERLGLRMRLLMRGLAIDGAAAESLALLRLRQSLPPAGRLVRDVTEVKIGPLTAWDPTTQTAYFSVRGVGTALLDIDERVVREAVAGKPIREAAIILQTRWQLAKPPEIRLGPDWLIDQNWLPRAWRERMPPQPGRILVTVDLEGALREIMQ